MSEEEIAGDPIALRAKNKTLHEALINTDVQLKEALIEIDKFRALLQELIDIEGPQPGTAEWADKVRAALGQA